MARGCARIDSRPDTAKIGSADHLEVHHARLLAVIGVRKTFPHGLDPNRTFGSISSAIKKPRTKPGLIVYSRWKARLVPRDDRSAKAIVDTGGDQIDVLPDVDVGVAPNRV